MASFSNAQGQVLTPVSFAFTSGTTGDAFVGPAPGDFTANQTIDGSAYYLAEQGQDASDSTFGIPDGSFVSGGNSNATFIFQPANGNNILKGDGTLMLTTPEGFSNVSFLVQSLGGSNDVSFTLNFAGGGSETFTTTAAVPYWVNTASSISGGVVALGPIGAIDDKAGDGYNGSSLEFYEYDFALAPGNVGSIVNSVSVDANGNQLVTYAMSGTVAIPEPSTWAMLLGGLGVMAFVGRFRAKLSA
jgi:hypothetical protein